MILSLESINATLTNPEQGFIVGEGFHHRLVSDKLDVELHGVKIDLEKNNAIDSPLLYISSLAAFERCIRNTRFARCRPTHIIGIANGMNQFAVDLAERMGYGCKGVRTVKLGKGIVRLDQEWLDSLDEGARLTIVDDVLKTGQSISGPVEQLLEKGVKLEDIDVMALVAREENARVLDRLGVKYRSIMQILLATYTKQECEVSGPCSRGAVLLN